MTMRNFFAILLLLTTGCSTQPTEPRVLADSAFSGRALLDMNGNGRVDSEDTPIENATFSVELDGVKVFSETPTKQALPLSSFRAVWSIR